MAGIVAAATILPAQASSDWEHERRDDRVATTATSLEIIDPLGDVRLRTGDPGELRIVSNLQWLPGSRPELILDPGTDGRPARIELSASEPSQPSTEHRNRADIAVLVPPEMAITVETLDGLVEAKGLPNRLEITTERGDVRVRASAPVESTTVHGSTHVVFRAVGWAEASKLGSTTGEIRAELPRGSDPQATVETRGEVTSDYSIVIERDGTSLLKTGSIGHAPNGAAQLVLKSYSGPIKLLEMSAPPEN